MWGLSWCSLTHKKSKIAIETSQEAQICRQCSEQTAGINICSSTYYNTHTYNDRLLKIKKERPALHVSVLFRKVIWKMECGRLPSLSTKQLANRSMLSLCSTDSGSQVHLSTIKICRRNPDEDERALRNRKTEWLIQTQTHKLWRQSLDGEAGLPSFRYKDKAQPGSSYVGSSSLEADAICTASRVKFETKQMYFLLDMSLVTEEV